MQIETIIIDGYGNWLEVYQGDNHVYLEDKHIAEIVRIHFGLGQFSFNDLIDAIRDWNERRPRKESESGKVD